MLVTGRAQQLDVTGEHQTPMLKTKKQLMELPIRQRTEVTTTNSFNLKGHGINEGFSLCIDNFLTSVRKRKNEILN